MQSGKDNYLNYRHYNHTHMHCDAITCHMCYKQKLVQGMPTVQTQLLAIVATEA